MLGCMDGEWGKANMMAVCFSFFTNRLTEHTTQLAENCEAVVLFVNDLANEAALRRVRLLDHSTTPSQLAICSYSPCACICSSMNVARASSSSAAQASTW